MGGSKLGVKFGETLGQEAILGHGEKNPGLPHHHDQNDGAQAGNGPQLDQGAKPTKPLSGTVNGQSHRSRDGQLLKGDDSGKNEGDEDVENRANQEGAKDSFGHIALWVA